MPKTKISEFSATPGNNTDIDGINISEGCAPSGINDAIRELMAQLKDFQAGTAGDSFNGPVGTTTAAAGAFTNLSASGTFALTGDQVQISEGGTGQTTANAAFNALAPSQTSNAGKYLKTDGTNTSWDALDISTADITGTLPIANGGTGLTALGTGVQTALGQNVTGSGGIVLASSPSLTTPNLGTPSAVTLTNATGLPLSTGVTGTLATTNGGTGLTSFTANGVVYASSSSALTTGSALTFDGTNFNVVRAVATDQYMSLYADGTGPTFKFFGGAAGKVAGITADSASAQMLFTNEGNKPFVYQINGTEGMRLTSTGLGIGTSSPTGRLSVKGSTSNSSANAFFVEDSSSAAIFRVRNDGDIYMGNGGKAILDSSGNLGLGVTPSASTIAQFEGGSNLLLVGRGNAYLSNNATFNSGFKYINTAAAGQYNISGGAHIWQTAPSWDGTGSNAISFTQAMTLDASGNLLVGGTSVYGATMTSYASASRSGGLGIRNSAGTAAGGIYTGAAGSGSGSTDVYVEGAGILGFITNNAERARITSGGYSKFSNDGNYTNAAVCHEFYQTANNSALLVRATNSSYTSDVLTVNGDRATTNATYNLINAYNGTISGQFIVRDSGNAVNTNGSYGTISDAKMKADIVDAGSQWADIKAVRFRKFKMKNDPTGLLQLGVVAQELEQTSPGLVDEHIDRDGEGNDLGTTTKSVKTSVLLMKAAVALQEAMARIEQLEAKVAALETK